jgi:hypothetical protein
MTLRKPARGFAPMSDLDAGNDALGLENLTVGTLLTASEPVSSVSVPDLLRSQFILSVSLW